MSDFNVVIHEIGTKGEFTRERAREAAAAFARIRFAQPNAEHGIVVGGYDDDHRELWDIPEAKAYVRDYTAYVALYMPGRPLSDWKFQQSAMTLLAMCSGFGKIVGRDPETGAYTIQIGTPSS